MPAPAAYRYTMIFQYVSGANIGGGYLNLKGGWTESVYWTSTSSTALTQFRSLCIIRASMLPTGAYISGIRIQGVDPSGSAQLLSVNYPGGMLSTPAQDIPQMALLISLTASGRTNVRRMRLAAIPDAQISYGEFRPTNDFVVAYNGYLSSLNGWLMRGRDLTQTPVPLVSIDAAGNYVTTNPFTPLPGSKVRVTRAIDAYGNPKGGIYVVSAVPTTTTGTLLGWQWGVCAKGSIVPYVLVYPAIVTTGLPVVARAVVRKIGRPSLTYRGRRSKTKK